MRLGSLKPARGERKARKRVGRGQGSGHGKTSCRGQKGQKSRAGAKVPPGFEGGQMPLQRRLPKRGFRPVRRKEYALVHVGDLDRFEPNSIIDEQSLLESGLIRHARDGIKVLSEGEISHPVTLRVNKLSRKAQEKIEAAGGKVEEI